jgi:hypothetical protein
MTRRNSDGTSLLVYGTTALLKTPVEIDSPEIFRSRVLKYLLSDREPFFFTPR